MRSILQAISVRVAASATYVLAVFLVNRNATTEDAAALVYLVSICFVSSALGRIGSDQQLAAHASNFRSSIRIKAASLYYSRVLLCVTVVPLVAIALHGTILLFGTAPIQKVSLPLAAISAALFALSQTSATTWQASGFPTVTVIIFPFIAYASLCTIAVWDVSLILQSFPYAFGVPAALGFALCAWRLPFRLDTLSLNWVRQSWSYYLIDINFYLGAWAPFTYLHFILTPAEIVILNLATRLAALQSMPSNSISSYLMPAFSISFRERNMEQVRSIMTQVILLTMGFQALYMAALLFAYFLSPQVLGMDTDGLILVLIILAIGQFVNGLAGPIGPALLMSGAKRLMAISSWVLLVCSTIAGIVFAIFGGVLAFSVSISLAVIAQNFLYIWFLHQRTGVFVHRQIGSSVIKALKRK